MASARGVPRTAPALNPRWGSALRANAAQSPGPRDRILRAPSAVTRAALVPFRRRVLHRWRLVRASARRESRGRKAAPMRAPRARTYCLAVAAEIGRAHV